ncbi:MAG: polysaccharide biosynthesis protein, partial [Pseudobdellovibrionaceae bacterium]
HQPEVDIKIVYTGLRPGEKLFEELFHSNEKILPTLHPMVKIAKTAPPDENFKANLDFLMTLSDETSPSMVKEAIKNLLPEYKCSDFNIGLSDKVH